MTSIVVAKGNDGLFEGLGDKGRRAYLKLQRTMAEMEIGETLKLSFNLPRSGPHHRFFFSKLAGLFDRQERFDDVERLRCWVTVGAGYCDLMPGHAGALVAVPQSLAFDKMDEAEFVDMHQKITAFLWSPRAREFLWPHLDDLESYDLVELWHLEFDKP